MCGIAGLFIKSAALEPRLGALLSAMLVELGDRGPDSAGLAVYRDPVGEGRVKLSLHHADPGYDWAALAARMAERFAPVEHAVLASHAVFTVSAGTGPTAWLAAHEPEVRVMSAGDTIEIFKEMGHPCEVVDRFGFADFGGTHALGHTRMATESAVTTEHSHPFSTGQDLCLVHNGSLSNHNRLREQLRRAGVQFGTDNDSEVAAGYLAWRLAEGASTREALESSVRDLDGFYTFAVGSRDGFAVLRDPIACKPAVLAETDEWVAMASEYRAIAPLPGAELAEVWEPEPARVYEWSRA